MSEPDFQPTLVGPAITVRPIAADDWSELFPAGSDPEIWKVHPVLDRYTETGFRKFFDGAVNTLAGMREAVTAQRDEAVRESAHRMKGAALNLGLKALARTAQMLQQHAAGGSTDAAERMLDELASQLSDSRSECARLGLM